MFYWNCKKYFSSFPQHLCLKRTIKDKLNMSVCVWVHLQNLQKAELEERFLFAFGAGWQLQRPPLVSAGYRAALYRHHQKISLCSNLLQLQAKQHFSTISAHTEKHTTLCCSRAWDTFTLILRNCLLTAALFFWGGGFISIGILLIAATLPVSPLQTDVYATDWSIRRPSAWLLALIGDVTGCWLGLTTPLLTDSSLSLSLITWAPIPTFSATWSHILVFPLFATLSHVSYLNCLDNSLAKFVVNLSGMCHLCYKMLLRHLSTTVLLSLLFSSCKSQQVRQFVKNILIGKDTNSYLMSLVMTYLVCIYWNETAAQFHTVCNSPAAQG